MSSQPPEVPEPPEDVEPTAQSQGSIGPEFVPPLADSGPGEPPAHSGYEIGPPPAKRYEAKTVWPFLGLTLVGLWGVTPISAGLISRLMSPDTSVSYGWLAIILPVFVAISAAVGLYLSRADELPNKRSRWMGVLIGAGLVITCVPVCYGALGGL